MEFTLISALTSALQARFFFLERAIVRVTRPFSVLVCAYSVPWWDTKGIDDVMSLLPPCLVGIIIFLYNTIYTMKMEQSIEVTISKNYRTIHLLTL